jgi:hypothetical protein
MVNSSFGIPGFAKIIPLSRLVRPQSPWIEWRLPQLAQVISPGFADRGQHPDPSTIKKKHQQPWRRIASQLERRVA